MSTRGTELLRHLVLRVARDDGAERGARRLLHARVLRVLRQHREHRAVRGGRAADREGRGGAKAATHVGRRDPDRGRGRPCQTSGAASRAKVVRAFVLIFRRGFARNHSYNGGFDEAERCGG